MRQRQRVLIAPQEYKGTLTAVQAADAIAAGLARAGVDLETDLAPMADGGPGTAEALVRALDGRWHSAVVSDPLGRQIEGRWARLGSGVAVVECAEASGLWRLKGEELDPRRASTYGTGELLKAAIEARCTEILIGLGGSATNDGGAGMAQALGFSLVAAGGGEVARGGAALARLDRIDAREVDPRVASLRVRAATDVTNPLCGPEGASAVYGPQKGADANAVQELDSALRHLAEVIKRDLGVDVLEVPGAGAAGGMGAGVIAFLGGTLEPGARLVGEAADLPARVAAASLVITGEGRLDGQTAFGKAPAYVARLAREAGVPVVCLPGALGPGHERSLGLFDLVLPLSDRAPGATAQVLGDVAVEAVRRFV